MLAIDTMILIKGRPDLLNRIAVEWLRCRALEAVEARRKVEAEEDWNELAKADQVGGRKANFEDARQVTKREVNILKARNKLYKHKERG